LHEFCALMFNLFLRLIVSNLLQALLHFKKNSLFCDQQAMHIVNDIMTNKGLWCGMQSYTLGGCSNFFLCWAIHL
jgi:hypothetical protein